MDREHHHRHHGGEAHLHEVLARHGLARCDFRVSPARDAQRAGILGFGSRPGVMPVR